MVIFKGRLIVTAWRKEQTRHRSYKKASYTTPQHINDTDNDSEDLDSEVTPPTSARGRRGQNGAKACSWRWQTLQASEWMPPQRHHYWLPDNLQLTSRCQGAEMVTKLVSLGGGSHLKAAVASLVPGHAWPCCEAWRCSLHDTWLVTNDTKASFVHYL